MVRKQVWNKFGGGVGAILIRTQHSHMSFPLDIIPNRGLGHILFGSDPDHVRRELGAPSSIEDWSQLNEFASRWVYSDPDCSLFFFEGAVWNPSLADSKKPCLVMITAISPCFILFGDKIIGEAEEAIRSRLSIHGLIKPTNVPMEQDRSLSSQSEKHLSYADAHLSVYLLDSIVTHIQWNIHTTQTAPSLLMKMKGSSYENR